MVYNSGLVAVIKVDGKVLRERDGTVYLPFGSEYSIGLKNKKTKKALVSIEIDGESIGDDLILRPNQEIDLDCFTKNMDENNRFKFLKKTKEVKAYRGDHIDDGIIRIEYDFEINWKPLIYYDSHPWKSDPWVPNDPSRWDYIGDTPHMYASNVRSMNNQLGFAATAQNDNGEGFTAPGSISDQSFVSGNIGALEGNKKVIIFNLKGGSAPVLTRSKIRCISCGKLSPSRFEFCPRCGTSLDVR
jgi:hypothetical protein